jgi:peptidoglycan/xylan/chitin deacetylase (PgdA/CDA1 family)
MIKRFIILLVLVLLPVWAWGATYYVSPTGSNTSPYDTWAKAANVPATLFALNPAGGPHTIYIAPGTYDSNCNVSNANWAGVTIVGTSAHGSTSAAVKGQVIISKATQHGLYAAQANITAQNLTFTGTDATHDSLYIAAAGFTGTNLYAYTSGRYLLYADTGATGFNISQSKFMGAHATAYPILFTGNSAGTFAYNIVTNDLTTAGATSIVRFNSSGTINFYNNTVLGSYGNTIEATGAGILNATNNLLGPSIGSTTAYTVSRTAGTVNLTTNWIGTNWYSTHRMLNGTINTDSGNVKTGASAIGNHQRAGYIVICVDDAEDVAYAAQVETELALRGLKGSFFVQAFTAVDAHRDTIQAMINRGTMTIHPHSFSHSDLTLTGNVYSLTKAGATFNVDRTANTITVGGAGGGTVTGYRAKNLLAIRSELQALGVTVGAAQTNLNLYSLGEIMADSAGAQASPYTPQLLIDTTAATGYYKTEIADAKSYLESNFTGLTITGMATPYGTMSANAKTAMIAAGYSANRINNTTSGSNWTLASIDLYNLSYADYNFTVGASDELTKSYIDGLCEMLAQKGGVMFLLMHTATEVPIATLKVMLDEIAKYRSISVVDFNTLISTIKASPWSTADNITYTRTWTDGGNYVLRPGSPAINAGTDVGLTTDYLGRPIRGVPDIGAYEFYGAGGRTLLGVGQ